MIPAVSLSGLVCRRGAFTLGPLDLDLPKGAVVALIGPNGSGKTTLLDLLMGLGAPQAGRIEVLGLSHPRDEAAIKARVAYAGPDLNFTPWGKVGRALDFIAGFYSDWDDARCERLLKAFGLSRSEKIFGLSFGGRIKLSLVMALSRNAEIILLDEPTIGLDVASRLALTAELLDIMRREGKTIVISSHQMAELERVADHVVLIAGGKVLVQGRMDELTSRYVQLDVRAPGGPPPLPGMKVLAREGERMRLLFDTDIGTLSSLREAGLEILAETPTTLEDLFVALLAPAGGRA